MKKTEGTLGFIIVIAVLLSVFPSEAQNRGPSPSSDDRSSDEKAAPPAPDINNPVSRPHRFRYVRSARPIRHEPIKEAPARKEVSISVRVPSFPAGHHVFLFYRETGRLEYRFKALAKVSVDRLKGVVPARYVTSAGVDYFLALLDGDRNPVALLGEPDWPFRVRIRPTKKKADQPTRANQVALSPLKARYEHFKLSNPMVTTPLLWPGSVDESPMAMAVIERSAIQRSPYYSIPGILKQVAGVESYTKTYSEQVVGIRGLARDKRASILVMVDGMPVNAPTHGGMLWPQLPLFLIDVARIEVVKGPASALYGADAFSGAINIITRSTRRNRTTFDLMLGQGWTQQYVMRTSRNWGKLGLSLTLGWKQTESHHDEETNTAITRINNYQVKDLYRAPHFSFKMSYNPGKHLVSLFTMFGMGSGGYNDRPGVLDVDRADWRSGYIRARYRYQINRKMHAEFNTSLHYLRQHNYSITFAPQSTPRITRMVEKYHVSGLRTIQEGRYFWRNRWGILKNTLSSGLLFSTLGAKSFGEADNLGPETDYTHYNFGLYVQDAMRIGKYLGVVPALRYDYLSDIGHMVSFRGDVLGYIKKHVVRTSIGMGFRRPDLFSQHGVWFTQDGRSFWGNEQLKAEKILSVEAEYRTRIIPLHQVKLNLFYNLLSDMHKLEEDRDRLSDLSLFNSGRITQLGLELEMRGIPLKWLYWYANYSLLYQKDKSGTQIFSSPVHKFNLGVSVRPLKWLRVSLNTHVVVSFANYDNLTDQKTGQGTSAGQGVLLSITHVTPTYFAIDMMVQAKVGPHLELGLMAQSLAPSHYEYPLYTAVQHKILAKLTFRY